MRDLVQMLFGEGDQLDVLQMSMRSGVVFALALAMIRISGRRSFGQRRPFDACATVLLHRFVAMASVRWPRFETLVSGDKRELVRDGRCDRDEMQKALITERDLDEAIRKQGGDERRPVRRAVLERDGVVTVDLERDAGQ